MQVQVNPMQVAVRSHTMVMAFIGRMMREITGDTLGLTMQEALDV